MKSHTYDDIKIASHSKFYISTKYIKNGAIMKEKHYYKSGVEIVISTTTLREDNALNNIQGKEKEIQGILG